MFSEPDDPEVVARMRTAHAVAGGAIGAVPEAGAVGSPREAWGWRGRTLGRPVAGPYGPGWTRVVHSPADKAGGKLWTGPEDAERALSPEMPRPHLHLVRQWTEDRDAYRAELYDRVDTGAVSSTPVLVKAADLPAAWWKELRNALVGLTRVRTNRVAVRQAYLDRAMPTYLSFLDVPVPTVPPAWSTAHGDLHWANLTAPDLCILDWEGWGLAPVGYDAALLHAYSLSVPETAEQVRRELSNVLDSDAGRFAELVVITELLQSAQRGDNTELVPALRQRAKEIAHRRPADKPTGR
ncbi:phosphotransferase [Streptomyces sp. NBC_01217]|uniref:phosphotransferase n=1 Tax=Streptomyces sp. NBC_01217 TaxID=2903779 RepID=UPI002E132132|nr:phosphotransferase [Streptomyces sp. NBC_01217]